MIKYLLIIMAIALPAQAEPPDRIELKDAIYIFQVLSGIRANRPEGWVEDIEIRKEAICSTCGWAAMNLPVPAGQRWYVREIASDAPISSLKFKLDGNDSVMLYMYTFQIPRAIDRWMEPGQVWWMQMDQSTPLYIWTTIFIEVYEVE